MITFWSAVGAVLIGVAILGAIVAVLAKPIFRLLTKVLRPEIMTLVGHTMGVTRSGYQKNPLGLLPITEKLTTLGLVETRIRAQTGKPPSRPLGSPKHFSPWDDLLFYFANVYPMPTADQSKTSFDVVIGPNAKQPLKLKQPVLITAMSYGGALSLKARLALAAASAEIGTATNSGEGVFIEEERKLAKHYIIQYHRGLWPTSPQKHWDVLEQADAIEIQLSQGAQGAASMKDQPSSIHPEMRRRFALNQGEEAVIGSRLAGINRPEDLVELVRKLKKRFPVPVGVKFAATQQMEREMEVYLDAGVDFLTIDGAEGGTHGGPPILQDAMGIPTLWGIARARRFLESHGATGKVSILAAGGLLEPGDFLKAIALGATACYSGSAIVIAMLSDQLDKALMKGAPPYALLLQSTTYLNDALNKDRAAQNVVKLFTAWHKEWDLALRAMGKTKLAELGGHDLVARTRDLADALGVAHVSGPLLHHDQGDRQPRTDYDVQAEKSAHRQQPPVVH